VAKQGLASGGHYFPDVEALASVSARYIAAYRANTAARVEEFREGDEQMDRQNE
jgi:hypothetical protein